MWNNILGILAILGVLYFLASIQKRFENIERTISKEAQPISYKIRLSICPHWPEIIKWCFPERDPGEVVEQIHKEFEIDIGEGLYLQGFRFKHFHDGVSGLDMIWSDYHKTFVDEIEVGGFIFEEKDRSHSIFDKDKDNKIGHPIHITPSLIGFPSFEDFVPDENKITAFPYTDVVNYLLDPGRALDTFEGCPPALQEKLNEYNIKYEPDRYGNYGRPDGTHIFSNKYYSIYLNMKIVR